MNVAVVGSGAAGLSAAWQLVSGGARVTVFESESQAGGVLRTVELEGP
jgi:protoporphyrinogen oxidase